MPDTFCRLGVGLDPTDRDEKSTYDLLQDAPLLLAEVKRLRKGIIDIADKWEQPSIIRGFLKELKELIE